MKDRKILAFGRLSRVSSAFSIVPAAATMSEPKPAMASRTTISFTKTPRQPSERSGRRRRCSISAATKRTNQAAGIGVNGFLWRASLDTVSFMPIASADPFGGIIITDWYSSPNNANERMRLNIFIRDRELRADGVKVSVFRQTKGPDGHWTDAAVTPTTGPSLENAILTKARQIRLTQKASK